MVKPQDDKSYNDLTVAELKKKLAARGLSKGNSGLRKNEIIPLLLANEGHGSKAAVTEGIRARRRGAYVKKTTKEPRARRSKSASPKKASPKKVSPKKVSPKRVDVPKPMPASEFTLKSLSPIRRRTPPPPLPRDVFPTIVSTYAKACDTTDQKEAKRIIKCLCDKFPGIVRCAKKGEKAKSGEIALSARPKSPRRSPPKASPIRVSPARSSPARAIPVPPPPPPPVFVKKTGAIDLTKVRLRPTEPAPSPSGVGVAQPNVVITQCLPGETMTSTGTCVRKTTASPERSGHHAFNQGLLNRLAAIRGDVSGTPRRNGDDDDEWM